MLQLKVILQLLPEVITLIKFVFGLPKDQQGAYLQQIRNLNHNIYAALERAKNEKDPSDLSRILSELPDTSHND